jgi:hypothetical protein
LPAAGAQARDRVRRGLGDHIVRSWIGPGGQVYGHQLSVAQAHTRVLEQQPSKPPDPSPLVPTGLVLEQEPTGRHQRRRSRQDGDRTHISGEVRYSSAPHPPAQIVQRARGRSPRFCFRHDPSSRHRSGPRSPSTSGGPRSRSLCARLVVPGEELERPASLRLGITVGVELVLDQQGPEGIPRFDRFVGVDLDR